jgi:hypothetical protein
MSYFLRNSKHLQNPLQFGISKMQTKIFAQYFFCPTPHDAACKGAEKCNFGDDRNERDAQDNSFNFSTTALLGHSPCWQTYFPGLYRVFDQSN